MLGNNNNAPAVEPIVTTRNILERIDPQTKAQELIDRCVSDITIGSDCVKNEQQLWTYMLHRDYPQWGVIGNAKEYYIRIAAIHGVQLRNTSGIFQLPSCELFRRQAETVGARNLTLQIQVGETEPFPVANVVGRTYSGALAQFLDNIERYNVTDPNGWIFRINDAALDVEHLNPDWANRLRKVLVSILSENKVGDGTIDGLVGVDIEAELIASFDYLQCQAGLCDILAKTITERLKRLGDEAAIGNVSIEPVKLIRTEFGVAPGAVLYYFQYLTNVLFMNDAFTEPIIDYYKDLIRLVPGVKLALLPRGYPFIKRDNIDRFDAKLFHVNPLTRPTVFPDYLNAPVFGEIDRSDPKFQMWRSEEEPYPIILQYPNEETIRDRMEKVLPGVNDVIEKLRLRLLRAFPNHEAGFIIAGGMFSIIFDDYLSTKTNWLMKTDVDFFVYGATHELRVKAFKIIMDVLVVEYPMGESTRHHKTENVPAYHVNGKKVMAYSAYKSVVTAQRYEYLDRDYRPVNYNTKYPAEEAHDHGAFRVDQYERSIAFQVINTNSKDGFEVIMNFDTSHIQVGFDCYDGWIATPYWELYYPRRETLLVRYNIRGGRFTKALYRGFTPKVLMPYALLLKMTGSDYASVIRPDRKIVFKPKSMASEAGGDIYPFPDDLRPPSSQHFSHRATIRKQIITKDQEIIKTGDMSELENPVRTGSAWYTFKSGEYKSIQNVVTELDEIFERVQYDGQFKNGFDGYVNSAYLTFKIAPAPQNNYVGYNKLSKFLLRDARIVSDSRRVPVEFPAPGTEAFKWSIMTEVLVQSKALTPLPMYRLRRDRQTPLAQLPLGEPPLSPGRSRANIAPLMALFNNPSVLPSTPAVMEKPRKVMVLAPRGGTIGFDGKPRRPGEESPDIYTSFLKNPDSTRAPLDGDFLPRHNLSLVAKPAANLDFPHPQVFRALRPAGDDSNYGPTPHHRKKKIIHKHFNFPIVIEGIVSFDSDEDFDSLDLHAPMLTDEQRDALPRLTYEEFSDIATGKLKLNMTVSGFQYVVTFPASVSESIFLDESDWTMPLDQALGDPNLRFNSICIFEYPILPEDDPTKEVVIKVDPGLGDEDFFANPPSILKIFRSFKIV